MFRQMGKRDKNADFRCPFCGSARVHRSRRHGLRERVFLRFLGRCPFRCIDCYKRFTGRSPAIHAARREPSVVVTRLETLLHDPSLERAVPGQTYPVERRYFSRVSCQIPAQVVVASGACITGVVSGISLNGCFVDTLSSVPVGSEIEVSLKVGAGARSQGTVRRSHARGMGIEFIRTTAPNFRKLQDIARGSVRLS